MTDLHCHILPGLDDGAQSSEEALTMARIAADSGTRVIACTPHWSTDSEEMTSAVLYERLVHLRRVLLHHRIPLLLSEGAEVLCLENTLSRLEQCLFPTLGGTRYLLCEFPFDAPPYYMEHILSGIVKAGYIPVIAHPERYDAVQEDPALTQYWISHGCLLQVNKGSLPGRFGQATAAAAKWILDNRAAHLIASDAHGVHMRTPAMDEAYTEIARCCSEQYAKRLFFTNPSRILQNAPVQPDF